MAHKHRTPARQLGAAVIAAADETEQMAGNDKLMF
jgi:hypothetical protein